jgi:hypothetical protein
VWQFSTYIPHKQGCVSLLKNMLRGGIGNVVHRRKNLKEEDRGDVKEKGQK